MKYMTKEWYQTMQNTSFHLPLHTSEHAEKYSQAFYRMLYKAREDEMVRIWGEVEKEYWNPDLPQEYKPPNPPSFDPETIRKNFRKAHRHNVKDLKENLLEYILRQVADVRVLALHFASAAVKQDITAWCKQYEKATNQTAKGYAKQYKAMLKKGNPAFLEDFSFHDCKVTSCHRQGNNLVIELDNSGGFSDIETIILEQCTILKQETPFRNAWWLYEEIYPVDGGWEIHALLQNSRRQLIDFIVRAASVRFKR
ncbi:MAG: DUF4085 domain-containing protein [Firmicutes bacterium]|nr:DUF4085 domain-containing protein [Bacillota bacterium]